MEADDLLLTTTSSSSTRHSRHRGADYRIVTAVESPTFSRSKSDRSMGQEFQPRGGSCLFGVTQSMCADPIKIDIQDTLIYRELLYPPSFQPDIAPKVKERINTTLTRYLGETTTISKEDITLPPPTKTAQSTTDEALDEFLKAIQVSSAFKLGFGGFGIRVTASNTNTGALREYQKRKNRTTPALERINFYEKLEGDTGLLNPKVIDELGLWLPLPENRDTRATYKKLVHDVLTDKIYVGVSDHADFVVLLHLKDQNLKAYKEQKGTLVVYAIIDRTAHPDNPKGSIMEGVQMSQFKVDWLLTINNVPKWLWEHEYSEEVGTQEKLHTSNITRSQSSDGNEPVVSWRVVSNDPAWQWFGQVRIEEKLPPSGFRSPPPMLYGQGKDAATWVSWVNDGANNNHAKDENGRQRCIGKNPREIRATVPQILCLVNSTSDEKVLHRIPQFCCTNAFSWGGTRMELYHIGDISYKMAGVGRLLPRDKKILDGERSHEVIARWKADKKRTSKIDTEPICTSSSPATLFSVWG